jgi:hypothetical protein
MRKIIFALAALLAAATVSAVSFPTGGKFKNLAQNNQQKLAEAEIRESNLVSKLSLSQMKELDIDLIADKDVDDKLATEQELIEHSTEFKSGFGGGSEYSAPKPVPVEELVEDLKTC